MKLIKYGFGLLLSALLITSCASKWPSYTVTNEDVSFESEGTTFSLSAAETPLTIKIVRGVATEAISVPLTLNDDHGVYTLGASKVDFAAGEYSKTVSLTYDYSLLAPGTEYTFTLSLPQSMAGDGCYYEFAGNGMMQLEYENYKDVEYEVLYYVNTALMAWAIRVGSVDEYLDATKAYLQLAKMTENYYKIVLFDETCPVEFKNNGDETISVAKYTGYNEPITVNSSTGRFVMTASAGGHTYTFTMRIANCGVLGSGAVKIASGDEIEFEGWIQRDGSYYPNAYNTYQDFLVD